MVYTIPSPPPPHGGPKDPRAGRVAPSKNMIPEYRMAPRLCVPLLFTRGLKELRLVVCSLLDTVYYGRHRRDVVDARRQHLGRGPKAPFPKNGPLTSFTYA